MSFLDKVKGAINSGRDELTRQVGRFKNKKFMQGTVAVCARIAVSSDGVSSEEKQKMVGFMRQSDALSVFDISEVIALFEKYAATFDFDPMIGKGECLKVIGKLKKDTGASRMLIRVCCAIGAADGNFDDDEKSVVREICAELGLNPSDFSL